MSAVPSSRYPAGTGPRVQQLDEAGGREDERQEDADGDGVEHARPAAAALARRRQAAEVLSPVGVHGRSIVHALRAQRRGEMVEAAGIEPASTDASAESLQA